MDCECFPTNLIEDICLAHSRKEFASDLHCSEEYRDSCPKQEHSQNQLQYVKPEKLQALWLMCMLFYKFVLHCPATHSSSPVSPSMSVPPLSAGRRGVTRRAEEDQWHAGGDSEENGQLVQTRQHLHHRRTAPGWAQLCYKQVHWFFLHFTVA